MTSSFRLPSFREGIPGLGYSNDGGTLDLFGDYEGIDLSSNIPYQIPDSAIPISVGQGAGSTSASNFLNQALGGLLGGLGGSGGGLSSEDIEDLTDTVRDETSDLRDDIDDVYREIANAYGITPQQAIAGWEQRLQGIDTDFRNRYDGRLYGFSPTPARLGTQEFVTEMDKALGTYSNLVRPQFMNVAVDPPVVSLDKKEIDKNMEYMENISRAIGFAKEGMDDIVGNYQGAQTQEFIYEPGGQNYSPTAIAGRLGSADTVRSFMNPTADYLPLTKY